MAALTLALQIARPSLWDPLSKSERAQIADWFGSIRGAGLHRNNHMFFNVMTLAFLDQEGFGRRADHSVARFLLDTLETMSLGHGWFIDGMNETVDYYNAYAFHYYGLWWAKLYGHSDPPRAARWKEWAAAFIKDYVHFFAASGENPPFGRSICYRFAASAPFALAESCGLSPIPSGQARRACTRNLDFFLRHPIEQGQHALSLGWTDEFPEITEAYSCAGSVYWAAKGFAPLLLPLNHHFWQSPEKPLPCELGDFSHPIPHAGLVVRGHEGEIEVLNNANGICVGNLKFGVWKWGKLSFRSGFGFNIASAEDNYPLDAALTAEFANGSIMGRHQCQPIAVEKGHCGSVYALGDRFTQNHVSVESRIWWKAGWQLHWHRIHAYQPAVLRLGTFTLPITESFPPDIGIGGRERPTPSGPVASHQSGNNSLSPSDGERARVRGHPSNSLSPSDGVRGHLSFASAFNGQRAIAIQHIHGFARTKSHLSGSVQSGTPSSPQEESRTLTSQHRVHLLSHQSLVLTAETDPLTGDHHLLALTWAGPSSPPAEPWTLLDTTPGLLLLHHPTLNRWQIKDPELPSLL
jgi:hypothetical protein